MTTIVRAKIRSLRDAVASTIFPEGLTLEEALAAAAREADVLDTQRQMQARAPEPRGPLEAGAREMVDAYFRRRTSDLQLKVDCLFAAVAAVQLLAALSQAVHRKRDDVRRVLGEFALPPRADMSHVAMEYHQGDTTATTSVPGGMPRSVVMCQGVCKNGRLCNKPGTYTKFDGRYCHQHVGQAPFQRVCPICHDTMTPDKARSLPCCGNAFHDSCLRQQTSHMLFDCSMCRARIDPEIVAQLHEDYVKGIGRRIFACANSQIFKDIDVLLASHNNG